MQPPSGKGPLDYVEEMQPTGGAISSDQTRVLNGYEIGRTLGKGTFGKVKLGKHLLTGEKVPLWDIQVAIKILEKSRILTEADQLRIEREIQILRKIRHPNIMQLYEIFETKKCLYLITEYAGGGELFDYIVSSKRLNERECSRILQQILNAVEYMHKLGIVHRDLKPQNLLLDANNNIKVVDFGLSNIYAKGQQLRTACGSPCYAAPEMVTAQPYDGIKTDIWSCGIILYAMCCGYLPFDDPNTIELYRKIAEGNYELPDHISSTLASLFKIILNTNSDKRATIEDIRKHPFCQQAEVPVVGGIIVGVSCIPIESNIVGALQRMRVDITGLQEYIRNNRHNSLSASYYLLLEKKLAESGSSILDYYVSKQSFINKYSHLERLQSIFLIASRRAQSSSPAKRTDKTLRSTTKKSQSSIKHRSKGKDNASRDSPQRPRSITAPKKKVRFYSKQL